MSVRVRLIGGTASAAVVARVDSSGGGPSLEGLRKAALALLWPDGRAPSELEVVEAKGPRPRGSFVVRRGSSGFDVVGTWLLERDAAPDAWGPR